MASKTSLSNRMYSKIATTMAKEWSRLRRTFHSRFPYRNITNKRHLIRRQTMGPFSFRMDSHNFSSKPLHYLDIPLNRKRDSLPGRDHSQ